MENEDKGTAPPKNDKTEPKIPSASEAVGPRPPAGAPGPKGKTKEEQQENMRLEKLGLMPNDETSTRGMNIVAQGTQVPGEDMFLKPKLPNLAETEGRMIINDDGDTIPAMKIAGTQLQRQPDVVRPPEPPPPPYKK